MWFYRLRQPSGLFWAKKYNNFLFQVSQSFVQDRFNEDDTRVLIEGLTSWRKWEVGKWGDKEKKENRNFLCTFYRREKNGDWSRKCRGHQTAAQTASPSKTNRANVVSAVCPTNFTARPSYNYKNMYNFYVLSRNFEPADSAEWSYYWLLRTNEFTYYWETKRLDLNRLSIWTTVFCTYYRELRVIECTYYREMTVDQWRFEQSKLAFWRTQNFGARLWCC